jgi:acyl-coenzyme A thioesterase PaaI-like protein
MLILETAAVWLLGLKIPAILWAAPRVLELDDDGCAIEVPLGLRTRNHVGSLYVGVLAAAADVAAGLNAYRAIRRGHRDVVPIFKELHADFLKRADGDTIFRSRQGREVAQAVAQADESGERVTLPVEVVATVPRKYGDEPVARFTLGLSLRRRDAARTHIEAAVPIGYSHSSADQPRA